MSVRHRKRTVQGFEVHTLMGPRFSVSVVPELGGRVVSLRDRDSGREWLDGWSPPSKRRLWRPENPADFASGPGAGIDECLPTVLPCRLGNKKFPDHGEIWNLPADFEVSDSNELICRWRLKSLPLAFERRISLDDGGVRLDYRLENLRAEATPFLWAWHALFSLKRGDQIRFKEAIRTCLSPGGREMKSWPIPEAGVDLSRAMFPDGVTPAAKVFIGPLVRGHAEIHTAGGDVLEIEWPAQLFPYAGIWITRGFWKGLHHWAIEPTNAPVDALAEIEDACPFSYLAPLEERSWTVGVRAGSAAGPEHAKRRTDVSTGQPKEDGRRCSGKGYITKNPINNPSHL